MLSRSHPLASFAPLRSTLRRVTERLFSILLNHFGNLVESREPQGLLHMRFRERLILLNWSYSLSSHWLLQNRHITH